MNLILMFYYNFKDFKYNATIIPISNGDVEIDKILNTGLFDFDKAQQAPGWLKELNGEHIQRQKNMV